MDPGIDPPNRPTLRGGPAGFSDYIFLLRPMILIPVWTFYLLGAQHGASASGSKAGWVDLLCGILSFSALLGAVYIMNQIADRDADRANGKLFLISDSIIPLGAAWTEAALLAAFSLVLGILFLPAGFAVVLLVSLALGAAYSLEPVRLKRRPVLDVTANAIGNGVLNTLAGWIASGAPLTGMRVLLPYPFAVASIHLATTLADAEGDRMCGFKTSGVVLGTRWGILISTGLMVSAAILSTAVGNRLALYACLLSLPGFLIPVRSIGRETTQAGLLLPVKGATLVFSITAGFLFPAYIPFLAAVILLTRLYYKRRFGIDYPSL